MEIQCPQRKTKSSKSASMLTFRNNFDVNIELTWSILSRIKKKTGLMSVAWGLCQDQARKDYVGQEWFSMTEARLLTNQRVVAELRTV